MAKRSKNRPRLGSVYQRRKRLPDGRVIELPTWWVKYRKNGRVFRESAKSELKGKADDLLKKRLSEIESGTFAGPRMERITIGELLDDLLLDYKVNGKAWGNIAKLIIRSHVRPHFGDLRAANLTTPDVQKYMIERQRQGAAHATINRECALLRRALNLGRMQTPPKIGRVPYIPKLRENNVRKGFLEYAEFVALRQVLPEEIRSVLTFAFYTGCRKGEILSLRWSQVDVANKTVRLEPGTTKNGDARQLPLAPELYQMLAMQKAIRDTTCPQCPWVFFRQGEPIKDFRGAWESACKAVGLVDGTGKPTRLFHDLRRTGVRNLIRAGVPERVVMKISGHRSRSVFDRYNIVSERDLQDAARRLGLYIEEARAKLTEQSLGTLWAHSEENPGATESLGNANLLN